MSDTKISALAALTGANVDPAADLLEIVDTSTTTNKKIIVNALAQSMIVLGTEQASTSGTSIDFTGIPSGTKRITINFVGVSTSGTSLFLVQIGDSGGIEVTGYLGVTSGIGSAVVTQQTGAGFPIYFSAASSTTSGSLTLNLEDSSDFTWTVAGVFSDSTVPTSSVVSGSKATSAELTQVRITTVNGSDTFDAGVINISYT